MARKRYVIVGDGAAGLSAAQKLRRADPTALIGLFSDDPQPAYYRAALTNYLLGELRDDQLWAVTPDFYDAFGIQRILGRVVRVDTARSELWESSSRVPVPYDALLVASGGRPRLPTFDGAYLPGVMTLRTLQDARRVVDYYRLGGLRRAVVLGGGALGLEWAHALREHDVHVTILERASRFLPGALDEVASDLLAARLRQAGIETVLGDEVAAAHRGQHGSVAGVTLKSGRYIECELVAAALGVLPNSEFLQGSGIKVSERGAVMVDRKLATSVANVWAAGDVASIEGQQLLLWEPARHQGRIAGENMAGRSVVYQPGVHYFATRLFDLDFARLGVIEPAPGREALVDFPRGTGTIAYRKLVFEGSRLVGALMIGERRARVRASGRSLKRLIDEAVDVSAVRGSLLDPSFDFEAFLNTQRLLEKPVARPQPAKAAPAKLRGTQVVDLRGGTAAFDSSLLARLEQARAGGTSLLPVGGGTTALPVAGHGTSLLPSAPSAHAPARPETGRGTRLLSIGFPAVAPVPAATGQRPLDARLEGLGRSWPIDRQSISIGRTPECDVVVQDPLVASVHAQVVRYGDTLYLRDAGSESGTWVDGEPLASAHRLRDGNRIRIGQSELVFRSSELGAATRSPQASGAPEPHLEVRSGKSLGLCFALGTGAVTIGSAPVAQIYLSDHGVAPSHAQVRWDGQRHCLSDANSGFGTWFRGGYLAPGQEVTLEEGAAIRVGAVELVYTARPLSGAASLLAPKAKLVVTMGAASGQELALGERTVLGGPGGAGVALAGLAPAHLEVASHGGRYWARDLSGGQTFKSGTPLGQEFVELAHGDLLLLGSGTMLRFEDV